MIAGFIVYMRMSVYSLSLGCMAIAGALVSVRQNRFSGDKATFTIIADFLTKTCRRQ